MRRSGLALLAALACVVSARAGGEEALITTSETRPLSVALPLTDTAVQFPSQRPIAEEIAIAIPGAAAQTAPQRGPVAAALSGAMAEEIAKAMPRAESAAADQKQGADAVAQIIVGERERRSDAPVAQPTPRLASGIVESNASFSGQAYRLLPHSAQPPKIQSPILDDIHTVWDQRRFAVPRAPIVVGDIKDRELYRQQPSPHVSDMPIKFPGTDYRIPVELASMKEALQKIIDFEHAVNPHIEQYFAYLTLDPRPVDKGKAQRGLGLHSDSIQGPRIQPKTFIEHAYVGADHTPTLFQVQPFHVADLDVDKHFFNAEFERQADSEKAFLTEPFKIYMIDAYSIHAATLSKESGPRKFFRLIFSVRRFDRLGNTHNPLFDYEWEMQPRPLPSHLLKTW